MIQTGGYRNVLRLSDQELDGSLPANHLVGDYGTTQGSSTQYTLALNPPTTELADGLTLQVVFHLSNGQGATLALDSWPAMPIEVAALTGQTALEVGDLIPGNPYLVVYTQGKWVCRVERITGPTATLANYGLVTLGTANDIKNALNEAKAVTPDQIKAYVDEVLTGVWMDKGTLNAAINPPFPSGVKGDAYLITQDGYLGQEFSAGGVYVQALDLLYCAEDNPGGTAGAVGEAWVIIEGNQPLASEDRPGLVQLSTEEQIRLGGAFTEVVSSRVLFQVALDNTLLNPQPLDFSTNDANLPAAKKGYAAVVSAAGKLGGPAAPYMEEGDLAYCHTEANPGTWEEVGTQWAMIKTNLQEATQEKAGLTQFATDQEAESGSNLNKVLNPNQVATYVASNPAKIRETIFSTVATHWAPEFVSRGIQRISILNENLVVMKILALSPDFVTQSFPFTADHSMKVLNLPIPEDQIIAYFGAMSLSTSGNPFELRVDQNGQLSLQGTFNNSGDLLYITLPPYVAKYPLEYAPNLS